MFLILIFLLLLSFLGLGEELHEQMESMCPFLASLNLYKIVPPYPWVNGSKTPKDTKI